MSLLQPSFLDRAIGLISPARGKARYQARLKFEAIKSYAVRTKAGSDKGTLGNWLPQWLNRWTEGRHREKAAARARDITANDPHAASIIDSMAVNIVGTGLTPPEPTQHQGPGLVRGAGQGVPGAGRVGFPLVVPGGRRPGAAAVLGPAVPLHALHADQRRILPAAPDAERSEPVLFPGPAKPGPASGGHPFGSGF